MKITKKNGTVRVYDDDKVIKSILKAGDDAPDESIAPAVAAALADEVFARLTDENEIITTADVRACLYALLKERGYPQTAESYMDFLK